MLEDQRLQMTFALEWTPQPGGGVLLRGPFDPRAIPASTYEAGLLRRFETPARVSDVLRAFPFHREESMAFLEDCVAHHLLLVVGADGLAHWPARVLVQPTLCGMPELDAGARPRVTFLGVPLDSGTSGLPGTRFGPNAIRAASVGCRYEVDPVTLQPAGFTDLANGRTLLAGVELADAGDVRVWPGEGAPDVLERTTQTVRTLRLHTDCVGVLGGDHSITHALLSALPPEPFGVLHLDAHPDLGDVMPGEPLHHGNFLGKALDALPHLQRVVQLGLRGMTGGRAQTHDRVTSIGTDGWRAHGNVVARVLELLPATLPLYVTLDIDVLDPAYAPSTGTPVPGGVFPHELKSLLAGVTAQRRIVGFDVVEVGESRAPSDGTAMLALDLLLLLADAVQTRHVPKEHQ